MAEDTRKQQLLELFTTITVRSGTAMLLSARSP